MARKGRYSFERRQRELAKADKREAKRDARAAKKLDEPATLEGDDADRLLE